MFRAVVVPKGNVLEGSTLYSRFGEWNVTIPSNDDIFEDKQPVRFYSDYKTPVHMYQHYYNNSDDIPGKMYLHDEQVDWLEQNAALATMKGKLSCALSELISPTDVYFKLITEMNKWGTKYDLYYQMYYQGAECYSNDEFINEVKSYLDMNLGPLILSTYSLDYVEFPRWYITGMVKDLLEFKEIDLSRYKVMHGKSSTYIFYKHETNIEDEEVDRLENEFLRNLREAKSLCMFPRETPPSIVKYKSLRKLENGQYTCNRVLDKDPLCTIYRKDGIVSYE